ncbi:MAG: MerR family transcriptional regulator [Clostridia bacterium]
MLYTIGDISKILNVPASTLRYYDKEGLLPFVERSGGGIRMFTEADLSWLKVIECLKKTGMSIKSIKRYIDLAAQGDDTFADRLQILAEHQKQVEEEIARMQDNLSMIQYKVWLYEEAVRNGKIPKITDASEVPEAIRGYVRHHILNSRTPSDQ